MTREELAQMLESEHHAHAAERIRAGSDPQMVLTNGLIARTRYADTETRRTQAIFRAVMTGEIKVSA